MAISDTPIFDFGLRRFRQVYSGKTVAYDHIIKRIRRDKGDPAYDGFLSSPRIPFGDEGVGLELFSYGNSLRFDGTNDFIILDSAITIPAEFTISLWFKSNELEYSGVDMLWGDSTEINNHAWIQDFSFRFRTATGGTFTATTPDLYTQKWVHLCLTRDASNLVTLYVNGSFVFSQVLTGSFNIDRLGSYGAGASLTLQGSLDEVAMWNGYSATIMEAKSLWNYGLGALATSLETQPNHYWRFDEFSGVSTVEAIGGVNGTLNNFTGYYWSLDPFGTRRNVLLSTASTGANNRRIDLDTEIVIPSEFCISFWFRSALTSGGSANMIFGAANTVNDHTFVTDTTIRFRTDLGGSSNFSATIFDRSWHHIFLTRNSSNLVSLYIDGVLIDSLTNIGQFGVGMITNYRSFILPMNGNLAEFAVWNGVSGGLTEAQALFNDGQEIDVSTVIASPDVYYKFDESIGLTAADSSGNGNDGTLTLYDGGYWDSRVPIFDFGNELVLDGINDYVLLGTTVNMSTTSSVNFWIKFQTDFVNRIISDDLNTAVIWTVTDSTIRVYVGGGFQDFTVPTMALGTYYMITVTRTSNDWRVWLNGVESVTGTKTKTGTFAVDTIGRLDSIYTDGTINEIAFWEGYALTQTEIDDLYNGGNGRDARVAVVLSPVARYFKCNETSGTVLYDSSLNEIDGFVSGGAIFQLHNT